MVTLTLNTTHMQLQNYKIVAINKGVIYGVILSLFLLNIYILL